MKSTSLTVLHFTCVFGCNFKRCELAGTGSRKKSINIAAKKLAKGAVRKSAVFVWKKSAYLCILTLSIEKQNTRRVWVCGVSA